MALQIAHVLRIKVDIGIRRARSAYPTIFERKQLDHVRSVVVLSGCIIAQGFEKLLVRLFFSLDVHVHMSGFKQVPDTLSTMFGSRGGGRLVVCDPRGILMAGR